MTNPSPNIPSLGMFYPDELDQIFCGTVQTFTPWDYKVCICLRAFSLIGRIKLLIVLV